MAGPFNWFQQVVAVTAFSLRSVPQRLGSSASAAVGIAGVVAVLVGVLSIAQGVRSTMSASAGDRNALVLRSGADTEMMSVVMGDSARVIEEARGVAVGEAGPLVSPELFVILSLPKRSTGTDANVPFRGVEAPAFEVRESFRIVEGRMFGWGLEEVIVGRAAAREFAGLDLGASLEVGSARWPIVGLFETGGGLAESEIWADAAVLQPAYRRGNSYQSVHARLASRDAFAEFKDSLTADPRLDVKVIRESEFYDEQSSVLRGLVTILGTLIAALMALGAVFGALNTMYTAVSARTTEIATLRALGFRAGPVVLSVLVESMALAAVGGLAGGLAAWLAFDGFQTATLNLQTFSQVAFAFEVTPSLLVTGILWALGIGFFGGLLPAIRAARLPVATALRES